MAGDANYAKVSNLFHFSVNLLDTAGVPATLAASGTGTAASLSAAHAKFGGSALFLQGSGYSSGGFYRFPNSAATTFGSGDFTLEAWIYPTDIATTPGFAIVSNRPQSGSGWSFEQQELRAYINGTWSDTKIAWAAPSLNTWHHMALVRSGGTLMVFVDGVMVGSTAISGAWPDGATSYVAVGSGSPNGSEDVANGGYINDLRITKGLARYTANFTPPAAPFPDGMGQVSGTVKDSAGAAAARVVRSYRRDTGALVANVTSDGVTGAYSFYAPTLDELAVMVLDDAAGTTENDLVLRVIPA